MIFSVSNFFWSNVWILYFDDDALLKNSIKIRNWVRWSDTLDVRLPDIDFVVWVRLQNIFSIRVDKDILVGKIMWGDEVIENSKIVYQENYRQVHMIHIYVDSISRKQLTSLHDSYLSWSISKWPNKSICVEDSFKSLYNKGEI